MPRIESNDPQITSLEGRHLWHAPLSSCSQRVRLCMAETGKVFESHALNLERGDHASEAYQKIHPKGLVPALVEDGVLFVESIDIIQHLAKGDDVLQFDVDGDLLERADLAQVDLKLLTFEFLFSGVRGASDEQAEAFQRNHKNEWLKSFYRDFATGFERSRIAAAVMRTAADFDHLEAVLSDGRAFLAGDRFSIADIAWLPNVHRFSLMDWPWERGEHLLRWFERVSSRASYQAALVDWQDQNAVAAFRNYTRTRQERGTDIRSFLTK